VRECRSPGLQPPSDLLQTQQLRRRQIGLPPFQHGQYSSTRGIHRGKMLSALHRHIARQANPSSSQQEREEPLAYASSAAANLARVLIPHTS